MINNVVLFKIYKEPLNFNAMRMNNTMKNESKTLTKTKRKFTDAYKHMKRYFPSCDTQEMQIIKISHNNEQPELPVKWD
jgi:hypothetical protein